MKLVRVGEAGRERPAVLVDDDTAVDVSGEVDGLTPELLGAHGLDRLREIVDTGGLPEIDLTSIRVGPCITRPSQIIGIGLNYADHAEESGQPVPDQPVIFSKAPNSLSGPFEPILLPPEAETVDWEVELGVVIGARARYLEDEKAAEACVAGYCVVNDVSERTAQLHRGGQWMKGKSAETFCPVGPWLVTPDESGDPQRLELSLTVNGELMQSSTTSNMVFGVNHLVWYLSQYMVLEPGDLITTGTPPGVGMGRTPPTYLRDGDVVELTVTGLGRQRQVCRPASRSTGG